MISHHEVKLFRDGAVEQGRSQRQTSQRCFADFSDENAVASHLGDGHLKHLPGGAADPLYQSRARLQVGHVVRVHARPSQSHIFALHQFAFERNHRQRQADINAFTPYNRQSVRSQFRKQQDGEQNQGHRYSERVCPAAQGTIVHGRPPACLAAFALCRPPRRHQAQRWFEPPDNPIPRARAPVKASPG